jgi:hypothetical protein
LLLIQAGKGTLGCIVGKLRDGFRVLRSVHEKVDKENGPLCRNLSGSVRLSFCVVAEKYQKGRRSKFATMQKSIA